MNDAEGRTRVYAPEGKLAHLLMYGDSPDGGWTALCGRHPRESRPWLGTGSQAEYEKAAEMPLCSRCEYLATEGTAAA